MPSNRSPRRAQIEPGRRKLPTWIVRAIRAGVLGLLVALMLGVPAGGTAFAQKKDLVVSLGYLVQRIEFGDDGFGGFLKRRYNVDHVDLRGPRVVLSYGLSEQWTLGLELDKLGGEFEYDTLNVNDAPRGFDGFFDMPRTQTAEFELTQIMLKLQYQLNLSWHVGLGYGQNTLARTLYGYGAADIVSANVVSQGLPATDESEGSVAVVEIIREGRGQRFGWEAGARYSQSKHDIPASSSRPGLDSRGLPQDQQFELSGIGYHAALNVYF